MNIFKRTNQGGTTLTFIIIGVLLALATVVIIYFVNQHGDRVRRDQAIAQAEDQAKKEQAAKDQAAASSPSNENTGVSGSQTSSPDVAVTPPAPDLPQTGASDDIFSVIPAALLVGVLTAYFSSRRSLQRSL